jgi:hypothetical protein
MPEAATEPAIRRGLGATLVLSRTIHSADTTISRRNSVPALASTAIHSASAKADAGAVMKAADAVSSGCPSRTGVRK